MISKQIYPESFDFGIPPVALIGAGSKGLDKQAMVKRGSADFRIILDSFERRPGYEYLHIITTGGAETYNGNSNADFWNFDHMTLRPPHPEKPEAAAIPLDGGLKKYHDAEYMKNGEVFKEHKTRRQGAKPSGYIVAAFTNDNMKRGELLIGVEADKWAPELHRKAQGKDIFFSLGADVIRDVCNYCGRIATRMSDHCDHMKYNPLELTQEGIRIGVYNDTPKFYDISGVEVPADRIAFALRHIPGDNQAMGKSASLHIPASIGLLGELSGKPGMFQKLAVMEKEIPAMCEGDDLVDACVSDENEEDKLIEAAKGYTVREVLDACNRSGIMLSPHGLFALLASELGEEDEYRKVLKSIGPDDVRLQGVFEDCCSNPEAMSDSAYDARELPDLRLLNLVQSFIPALGLRGPEVADRVIRITIVKPLQKSANRVSSLSKAARDMLSLEYAKYTVSYLQAHKDNQPAFAMRKIASIVRCDD